MCAGSCQQSKRDVEVPANSSITVITQVEVLRGRDGSDGAQGPPGPPGRDGLAGRDGRDCGNDIAAEGTAGPPGPVGPRSGGVVYTRWGRNSCPTAAGTSLVYAGRTGGSTWRDTGGGANYICMPEVPEYGLYLPGVQGYSPIYVTEYQTSNQVVGPVYNHNAPCAVCYVTTRETVLMIPAKMHCPTSWTLEYTGYLMAARHDSNHYRTTFECVDANPDTIPGTAADSPNAPVFYHTEAGCGDLPCGPYDPQKELTCAVCTK